MKQLHLQSATFLALYTFVKKAFMSAKTFVKINMLLDSISIHVGINMNSDGHQTEGVGSYTIKKLLTIRFKLKTSSSTKCNILYTFVKKLL